MGIENQWDTNDWIQARDAYLAERNFTNRRVLFLQFAGMEEENPGANSIEQFRKPKFNRLYKNAWISQVKVFDTVKGGYFTTGDLSITTDFIIKGYTPGYELPGGEVITEYAGDQFVWNGQLWSIADTVEPIQFGMITGPVWYSSVLRRSDRVSQGNSAGPF